MNISVIGCGRWGSLIAWYLDSIGHHVKIYGRSSSKHMQRFMAERKNDLLELRESVELTTSLAEALESETVVISIDSQSLRSLCTELLPFQPEGKTFILCMKGIEEDTGKRLSEVAGEYLGGKNDIAVWVGPGHVQEFTRGVPNCMVIDSEKEEVRYRLVDAFSSELIRFYYGDDLIGNEIGAAAKNVIGIAAGMLDGMDRSALKGALMSRGTREIARLIKAMGGNELSAYGLCHLGDYEATVFSPFSQNRQFGESFVKGESYSKLAEGYYTVRALHLLSERYAVELPICRAVYSILYEGSDPAETMNALFRRKVTNELHK
ncbi:MAG: NAD(P)H-dependent glycerol-3-phosphate dehydrogenase [Clostridiales bacterium]|nr:NAD(P)H-dependent glycerol-3-phosphate dehydrogenase [Candidatus Apopatocola equi]